MSLEAKEVGTEKMVLDAILNVEWQPPLEVGRASASIPSTSGTMNLGTSSTYISISSL